jgi:hypothetical protein
LEYAAENILFFVQGQIKNKGVSLFFIFYFLYFLWFFILGSRQRYHLRRPRKLSLEEVNGKCDFVAHATTHAKVLVAGLDHSARCVVIPRHVLAEQNAELLHHIIQLLFGEGQPLSRVRVSTRFLAVHGVVQVGLLIKVQHDALALKQARRAMRNVDAHEAERLDERLGGLDGLHGYYVTTVG